MTKRKYHGCTSLTVPGGEALWAGAILWAGTVSRGDDGALYKSNGKCWRQMVEVPLVPEECPQVMPANPKQAYGDTKVPLHLFPTTAVALGAMAFLEGREKYGSDNFRAAPIEAMTYIRAALSHIFLYREGEWVPDDSVVPHLGLALASIAILIDAHYAKSLIDNRNFPGGYVELLKEMQPLVQKIRDQHKEKNPWHYDIRDAKTGGR